MRVTSSIPRGEEAPPSAAGESSRRPHGDLQPMGPRRLPGLLVARIGVTGDSDTWIIGQDPLDSFPHFRGPVSHQDLTRMEGIPDTHSTSVVEGHPAGTGGRIQEGVQDGPVRHGIRSILHPLRFTKG